MSRDDLNVADDFEVLVVGTGPAGLTLANLLGKSGVRTLVIERDAGLSPHPKALNVDDEYFRLLHALGLGAALRGHGKYPIDFEYVSPLGFCIGYVKGRETEHNFPNRTAIFQPEFERILYEGATRFPNVKVVFDRELVSFAQDDAGVTVQARDAQGNAYAYRAAYLVGAEGSHSPCRKQLGISFDEVARFGVRHLVIDVADDPDTSTLALTQLGWRRNFISMPAPNGRRYEFSLREGEDQEKMLDDAVLARLFKPYKDYRSMKVIRKVGYTFHSRVARFLSQGRVFLVGDAAHVMPVFGSQGMNSGARDVNNLAWKLASVLRHGAPAALLDTYHSERHGQVIETIKMATANGALQRVRTPAVALLRDAVLGFLRLIPPAQRYIREMRYIPKPFLRSPLVLHRQEAGKKGEIVGRVLPLPTVRDGAEEKLLDDLLGLNYAIVGVAPQPGARPAALNHPLWSRLAATAVAVYPAGAAPAADGLSVVETADARFNDIFAAYAGRWLVLRPDRIVAAVASADGLAGIADELARTLLQDAAAPARMMRAERQAA